MAVATPTGGPGIFQKKGGAIEEPEATEELAKEIDQGTGLAPRSAAVILDLVSRIQNLEGSTSGIRIEGEQARQELVLIRAGIKGAIDQISNSVNQRGGRESNFWLDFQMRPVILGLEILESL